MTKRVARPSGALLVAAAALVLASCSGGGSSGTTSTTSISQTYTVTVASVGRAGTVLVNGAGRTLYVLTSEAGGNLTCTVGNGCAALWPPVSLPAGVSAATAGAGVDATKLSVITDSSRNTYVTYFGYPLYTYTGDSTSGTDNGLGVSSFGGTWYPMTASGTMVTSG